MTNVKALPIDIALIANAENLSADDGMRLQPPFRLSPSEYLIFAENDLEGKSTREYLNALHNAKRAIGCSIDSVLWNYGFVKQLKGTFPSKIESIREMGLVSPRIIRRLLHTRNLVEHGYETVTAEQAEDAVDIATLFSQSLRPFATCRYDGVSFSNYAENYHGNLLWLYDDGNTAHLEEHSPNRRTEVLAKPPAGVFFEIFRRIRGREDDEDCNVFFGHSGRRWNPSRLEEKRGLVELGYGSVGSGSEEFLGLTKIFVRAVMNSWIWSE